MSAATVEASATTAVKSASAGACSAMETTAAEVARVAVEAVSSVESAKAAGLSAGDVTAGVDASLSGHCEVVRRRVTCEVVCSTVVTRMGAVAESSEMALSGSRDSVDVAAAIEAVIAGEVVSIDVRAAIATKVSVGMDEAGAAGPPVIAVVGCVVDVVSAVPAGAEVVVAAVVPEVSAAPVSTVEAYSEVAEAVVDSAVVADGGTPVAGVPVIACGTVGPIAGRPEGSDVGR